MQEIIKFVSYHPMLSVAWIFSLIAVLFNFFENFFLRVKSITSGEAIRLINKENAIVIDIRQRDDFRKGHIIGSINLISSEIKTSNKELDKYKNRPIIIVDSNGMQAQGPANILNKVGFKQVFILKDGVFGWNIENLPLVYGK